MSQKIAFCLLENDRIAPRFDFAQKLMVVTVSDINEILKQDILMVKHMKTMERCHMLVHLDVNLLICGGVHKQCQEVLKKAKVKCINNVIGNVTTVLEAYFRQTLCSGQMLD
jgi:predicted Fe-Mo cluster-binding NifX family protein